MVAPSRHWRPDGGIHQAARLRQRRRLFLRPPAEPTVALHQQLQIPSDLPGSQAPPIRLPAFNPRESQPDRLAEIERLFRPLPELPSAIQPVEGASPLSLAELQDMALRNSPVVRQAMADVQAARGAAIQAGPILIQPSPFRRIPSTRAALPAIRASESRKPFPPAANWPGTARSKCRSAKRRTHLATQRNELVNQVRANYYAVLVAEERIKVIGLCRNSPRKSIEHRSDVRKPARQPPTNPCSCGFSWFRRAPNKSSRRTNTALLGVG